MTVPDPENHALQVGNLAHRVAGAMLDGGIPADRSAFALLLTRTARQEMERHPINHRPRAAFMEAVTAAGVYLNRFRPLVPWTYVASEFRSGNCRFDLVFQHRDAILIDEVKLGVSRRNEAAVREQIDRYLEQGKHEWGGAFIGVRLCCVQEPAESRLYLPDRKRSLLVQASQLAKELELR